MKYRMLLVEDDDRIREIVEDYFSAHKNIPGARNLGEEDEITVISAKDGDEGLVRIAEGGDMKMGKHRKKKVSFGRIWIAIALPVVALTIIALAIMSELLLTALFIQEEPLASEVAYETALRLKERELSSPKGCSDILNLEKSQMVAVLYDEQGNRLGESDISGYDNRRHIGKENYSILLNRLKEIPMTDRRERAGIEGVDLFGVFL